MPKTTARDTKKYPMATRLSELDTEHRTLVNFMEWITGEREGKHYELARLEGVNDFLTPCMERIDNMIFEYLGIDPKKLDQERRQMLEDMRNAQKKGSSRKGQAQADASGEADR